VLGVLAEKQKTTPDAYPMSLNALVTGCNQKSNRDPVLHLAEEEVMGTLERLQKVGLVNRLIGGRTDRWKHNLYEMWHVDRAEMAVLTELLLRSPQTEGELRTRVSRMEPIEDLEALRTLLRPMVQRRLVVYLTPERQRGTLLTHGFQTPEDLQRQKSAQPAEVPATSAAPPAAPPAAPVPPPAAARSDDETLAALKTALGEAQAEIAALKTTVNGLQGMLASIAEELRHLKENLRLPS
jgi:uncharacterized protein YceH (UPF0502 family)